MALGGKFSQPEMEFWVAITRHRCLEFPSREHKTLHYQIDFAWPSRMLAVEINGWEWHARFMKDHTKTAQRTRALTWAGWKVIPYTASEILGDAKACVAELLERMEVDCPGCNYPPQEVAPWELLNAVAVNPEHSRFNISPEAPPSATSLVSTQTELPERFRRFVTKLGRVRLGTVGSAGIG